MRVPLSPRRLLHPFAHKAMLRPVIAAEDGLAYDTWYPVFAGPFDESGDVRYNFVRHSGIYVLCRLDDQLWGVPLLESEVYITAMEADDPARLIPVCVERRRAVRNRRKFTA